MKPSLLKPIIIAAAVLLVIGGSYSFFGDSKNTTDDKVAELKSTGLDQDKKVKDVGDVEEVIAQWVEANPEAIILSLQNMQKKAAEASTRDAQKNISQMKNELFDDKTSPEYAPSGYDVTIVEFFDYACGYCKKANATVEALIKEDKKVRVIYKEFPILGAPSIEMSTIAIAVNMISPKKYRKFHNALMKTSGRGKDAAMKVAKEVGISSSKIESIIKSKEAELAKIIQANLTLGSAVGINGTPGFIIGDELIPGALGLQVFKDKIAAARAN